jgi:hypothetical protein
LGFWKSWPRAAWMTSDGRERGIRRLRRISVSCVLDGGSGVRSVPRSGTLAGSS